MTSLPVIDNVHNWAWANTFSPEECERIIDIGTRAILSPATLANSNDTAAGPQIRDSAVSWLYPTAETEWIFEKISTTTGYLNDNFFNFHLSDFAEGLQFTRYAAPNGHYNQHIDKAFQGPIRKLSLTIQLSNPNEYEGGDLILFYGEQQTMPKEQGKAIAFPSYVLHQVTPVTAGTRYSLVAWVTGNQFT